MQRVTKQYLSGASRKPKVKREIAPRIAAAWQAKRRMAKKAKRANLSESGGESR